MVEIGNRGLGVRDVVAVARDGIDVTLTGDAIDAMAASAAIVDGLAESDEAVYGVSTGFGSLATTQIPTDRRVELQQSLIRSHAAGMGPPVEREVVRAMMVLRARSLAMGYSGARPAVAHAIVAMLNAGITPLVPEHGSLGASGDLAPLAHCGLTLIGEGEGLGEDGSGGAAGGDRAPLAHCGLTLSGEGEVLGEDGSRGPAADALAEAGIEPLTLRAKE